MENLSREDIDLRIDRLKNRVNGISLNLKKHNDELNKRYEFAEKLGVKKGENSSSHEVI